MGLDVAEIMIALEEEFLIQFPDADFPKSDTIGDLVDFVSSKILVLPVCVEETAQLLNASRKKVGEYLQIHLHINADLVQDDTLLEAIFPKETRYRIWSDLRSEISSGIPELEGPILSCLCFVIPVFIALAGGVMTKYFFGSTGGAYSVGIALFAMSVFGMFWYYMVLLREKFYIKFPSRCQTFAHLVRWGVSPELRVDPNGNFWTEKTIDERVRAIIADAAGVQPNDLKREIKISKLF